MRTILIEHAKRYPEWQLEDLYKLLLQASRGAEHASVDRQSARRWLDEELASLGEGSGELLVDPITPSGEIVRVHLRPLISNHLDAGLLLDAFLTTMEQFYHSRDGYSGYSNQAAKLCNEGLLKFSTQQVRSYLSEMHAAGLPAVHHSERYNALYRPAYRVVARSFLPQEWLSTD